MTITDTTAERPGFAEYRAGGVFSTAVADAYAGTYGGAYNAVARKLGLIAPIETTDRMARGLRWEQRLADLTHAATGLYVHGEQMWTQNRDSPHHRAIVDGFVHESAQVSMDDLDSTVQFKTTGVGARLPWERTVANCMWEVHCTGALRSLLVHAVIDDDTDTLVRVSFTWIERDDFMIGTLIELAEMMWAHIQAGTLPDPDTPSALDTVKEVHALADADAAPVDLSDMADELHRFADIKEAVKTVESERDLLEAKIRERLGSATKGVVEGLTVSLSRPRSVFTPEAERAFLDIHPECKTNTVLDRTEAKKIDKALYAELGQPIGARALTVNPSKEKK